MNFYTLPHQEVRYMVYLTKGAGKYQILIPREGQNYFPERPKGQKYLPKRPQAAREGIFMTLKASRGSNFDPHKG